MAEKQVRVKSGRARNSSAGIWRRSRSGCARRPSDCAANRRGSPAPRSRAPGGGRSWSSARRSPAAPARAPGCRRRSGAPSRKAARSRPHRRTVARRSSTGSGGSACRCRCRRHRLGMKVARKPSALAVSDDDCTEEMIGHLSSEWKRVDLALARWRLGGGIELDPAAIMSAHLRAHSLQGSSGGTGK